VLIITLSVASKLLEALAGVSEVAITNTAICEPIKRLICLCSKTCLKYLDTLFPARARAIDLRLGSSFSSSLEAPRRLRSFKSRRYLRGKLKDIFLKISRTGEL